MFASSTESKGRIFPLVCIQSMSRKGKFHSLFTTHAMDNLASFPGSPSFRAIIPRMTFDPLFLRAGQRSYVELLRRRRESLGTRLWITFLQDIPCSNRKIMQIYTLMGKAWDSNIIIIVVNHVQRGNVDTLMKLMGKTWDSNYYYYCSKSCSKRKCRYSNEVDGESLGQHY